MSSFLDNFDRDMTPPTDDLWLSAARDVNASYLDRYRYDAYLAAYH